MLTDKTKPEKPPKKLRGDSPSRSASSSEDEEDDTSITRCPCDNNTNHGMMIQCETCLVWQHSRCVGILDKEVPSTYYCELCVPRKFSCVCGENIPRGKMIECKQCNTWQHIRCLGKAPRALPKPYKCPNCDPETLKLAQNSALKKPRLKPGRKKKLKGDQTFAFIESSSLRQEFEHDFLLLCTKQNSKNVQNILKQENGEKPENGEESSLALQENGQSNSVLLQTTELEESLGLTSASTTHKELLEKYFWLLATNTTIVDHRSTVESVLRAMSILMNCTVDTVKVWVERLCLDFAALCQSHIIIPASEGTVGSPKEDDLGLSALAMLAEYKETSSVLFDNDDLKEFIKAKQLFPATQDAEKLFTEVVPFWKVSPVLKGQVSDHGVFTFGKDPVPPGTFVGEYTGVVRTIEQVEMVEPHSRIKPREGKRPFLLFFEDLCIDAREVGNKLRFVRRSCTPNSVVKTYMINDTLRCGIFTEKQINIGEEITIPFDIDWKKSRQPLQCACGTTECQLFQFYKMCYTDVQKMLTSVHKKRKKRIGKEDAVKIDAKPKRLKKREPLDPNRPKIPRKKREKEEDDYTGEQEDVGEGGDEEGGDSEEGEEEEDYEEDDELETQALQSLSNPLSPATTTPLAPVIIPQPQQVVHPKRGRPSKQQQLMQQQQQQLQHPPVQQQPIVPVVTPLNNSGGVPSSPSGLSREDRKAALQWKTFQQMEMLQKKKRKTQPGSPGSLVNSIPSPSTPEPVQPVPEKKKPGRKKGSTNPQIKLTIPSHDHKPMMTPTTSSAPHTPKLQPQPQALPPQPKVQTPKAATPKPMTPKQQPLAPVPAPVVSIPRAPEKPASPISSATSASTPYFGKKAWVREFQAHTDPQPQSSPVTPTSSVAPITPTSSASSAPVNMKKKYLGTFYEENKQNQESHAVPTEGDSKTKPEPLIPPQQAAADGQSSILIQQ